MKKLNSLLALEILFLVFISFKLCESGDKSNKISIDDFPMTVGSQWTYVRTDSLIRQIGRRDPVYVTEIETVTVHVIRTHKKKHKEIICAWMRTFHDKVDTQYVALKRDTLKFIDSEDPATGYVLFQILFPIKVGNRWYGRYGEPPPDSYKVAQPESLEVEAGTFTDAYLIERGVWIPNNPIYFKYWIVPKVGIVKIRKWDSIFGEYTSENWDLIRYDIRE